MDTAIATLVSRARELESSMRRDAANGFARLNGAALFNHVVVAALLHLDELWSELASAPGRAEIPPDAWAAAAALRPGSEERQWV
jgi:hypothetical protein